jgi:hypothetical protein
MARTSLNAFVRSFGWKEWIAFISVVAAHVWAGFGNGLVAMLLQFVLGLFVGLALVGAWRVLARADRQERSAKTDRPPSQIGRNGSGADRR